MDYRLLCIFLVATAILTCGGGCATEPAIDGGVILEHQRRVTELESENERLRDRLGRYERVVAASAERLDGLRSRAREMGGDIDSLIEQFGEYTRGVDEIYGALERVQGKTAGAD